MVNSIKGQLLGKDKKICLVVSEFNDFITTRLVDSAVDVLEKHQVKGNDITVVWVPGAFEIPLVTKKIVEQKKRYSAVICLGAVIRGETSHFNYISNEVTKGIANVSMSSSIPVVYGIITADTLEQAIQRAGAKGENRGKQAALTALQMINLYESVS